MNELKKQVQEWFKNTFPKATWETQIKKMNEELREFETAETNTERMRELADVFIVAWNLQTLGCNIAYTILKRFEFVNKPYLEQYIREKLEINKARNWQFIDGVYKHVDNKE